MSTCWPKMLVEHSRVGNAPMYLDRATLERYRLIVVRMSMDSYVAMLTSIFLIRILNLKSHPEIVFIAENANELRATKTTKLGETHCMLASEITSEKMQGVLGRMAAADNLKFGHSGDSAPSIPGYTIRHPIAGTCTATLYRAFSHELGVDVALKIRDIKEDDNDHFHERSLRQEFEILRKLGGKYIATAYDFKEVGSLSCLALEYFPRGSVDRVIAVSGRKISRLDIMLDVAKGLQQIHNAGFLHLDLKPNNVMVREDGTAALIDFGISKRIVAARYPETRGYSTGSPFFVSPEQARGDALDERSDLFSFGALWYRVFTGGTPFRGKTIDEILSAHAVDQAPSMGNALRHYQPVMDGTVVSSPESRFENADVLIEMIEACAATATGVYPALQHDFDVWGQDVLGQSENALALN